VFRVQTMNPSANKVEVERLQAQVEDLENHARALLVAERRAYEAKVSLGRQLELLQKVNELGKILSATSGPADILRQAIEFMVKEFSYEAGAVLLLDGSLKKASTVVAVGGTGSAPESFDVSHLKREQSVLWAALAENRPVLVNGNLEPGDPARGFGLEDLFVFPLGVERSIPTGLFLLGNTPDTGVYYRGVKDSDVALLSNIAGQMALMLEKAELYEHLQKEKDELERAQMELRSVNESLEARVREKTQALHVSMEKLEESRFQLEEYSRELEAQVEERTLRLRESEQIYRSITANSKAGMAVYRDGLILEVNPALTEIVGEHLEGRNLSCFASRVADPTRRNDLNRVLSNEPFDNGNADGSFEAQAKRGDEERIWNISAFPLDSENRLFGLLVLDTTESRRVEEQLFGSQKMASLGNLAGGIAHEFNNILVGILGNASLLKTRIPEESGSGSLVDTIESSALRAAELVQQLLGFARKGKYRSESMDLNAVVRDTLELALRSFGPGIDIRMDLVPEVCPVEGDATQIQQVVMNLALNAKEAIGESGVLVAKTRLLTLNEEEARTIPGLHAGRWAKIEIQDTGPGIDENTRRVIFEPFFSTKGSGATGLGLPMVYGIVTNHGGAVDVRSEPGKGTSMLVYLPLAGPKDRSAPSAKENRVRPKASILVVDDEEILRRMCRDALTEFGYDVHTVGSGDAACEYIRTGHSADLTLLDLAMPGKKAEDTFRELRRMCPKMKIVICSGSDESEWPESLSKAAVHGSFSKPFTCHELRAAVEHALSDASVPQTEPTLLKDSS